MPATGVRRPSILVVDDYPPITDVLSRILENVGTVAIAENGLEALERFRAGSFDVVLCDVDMPVMNGLEFFRRAVSGDPGLRERFVFFTGSPTSESRAFFREQAVQFITKPALPQEVETIVSMILRKTFRERTREPVGVV